MGKHVVGLEYCLLADQNFLLQLSVAMLIRRNGETGAAVAFSLLIFCFFLLFRLS